MSTADSFAGNFRRVAKRVLAAVLLAMLLWGAAAIGKSSGSKSSVVHAGNSWGRAIPDLVSGNSWS